MIYYLSLPILNESMMNSFQGKPVLQLLTASLVFVSLNLYENILFFYFKTL